MAGHDNGVASIAFMPDGDTIVSGSFDKTVRIWGLSGMTRPIIIQNNEIIRSVAVSDDGKYIATGGECIVKIYNAKPLKLLSTLNHNRSVNSVAFSPNGEMLATGSDDDTVKIYNVNTGMIIRTLSGHSNWVWSVDFSFDGKMIVSGSGDNTIKIWDVETGKVLQTLVGHTGTVYSAKMF